jgi:hypothetical protein
MPSKDNKRPAIPPHERAVVPAKVAHWTLIFLRTLQLRGSVTKAAKAAGITYQHAYSCKSKSPKFSAKWERAMESFRAGKIDTMEAEIYRRGTKGWREPVFQGGELVGYKRKYSDPCLIRTLEAEYPEKWGRKSELSISGSVSLVSPALQDRLSDPEYRRLLASQDARLTAPLPERTIELPSPDDATDA